MVARQSTCLRRLSAGDRAWEVGFGRFLANENVTVERLIAGWSEQTASAVAGRHVIAIQDTSDINFRTTAERRRGLGEVAKAWATACWCMRWWRSAPTTGLVSGWWPARSTRERAGSKSRTPNESWRTR